MSRSQCSSPGATGISGLHSRRTRGDRHSSRVEAKKPALLSNRDGYLLELTGWTSSHPAILPLLLLPSIFPSIRVFSNESVPHIRWPEYRSFSISPSSEYSGLISFRIDWLDLLAVHRTLQHHSSSPMSQFESINSSVLSLLYGPTLTSVHDYWKNHSFDYTDLCQQSNVSSF